MMDDVVYCYGCGRELTQVEREYYGNTCEKCERKLWDDMSSNEENEREKCGCEYCNIEANTASGFICGSTFVLREENIYYIKQWGTRYESRAKMKYCFNCGRKLEV